MNLHLAEISRNVTPGAHAVVLLDGAGWHQTGGKHRVFDRYTDIVDACCDAWNALTADPGRIRSIATRPWASVTI